MGPKKWDVKYTNEIELNPYFEIRTVVHVSEWAHHDHPPTTAIDSCHFPIKNNNPGQLRNVVVWTTTLHYSPYRHTQRKKAIHTPPRNDLPNKSNSKFPVTPVSDSGGGMAVDSEKSFSEEKVWSLCKMPFWQSNNASASSSSSISSSSSFQSVHQPNQSHQLLQSSNAVSSMAKSLLPTRRRLRLDPPNKLYFPCKA